MIQEINKRVEILLIEDNPGDVRLTMEALDDGKFNNNLSVVEDGEEALAYLWKKGRYVKATRPDLILLDLNLPKKDGRQVLEEIKADNDLKRIPVVILTTSRAEEDIYKAYNYNANCYITKPIGFDEFIKVVKSIEDFWLSIVKLPSE
jgi:CheY-like chemotaxis protein